MSLLPLPEPAFNDAHATALFIRADTHYLAGQIHDALQLYEAVQVLQPGHPDVLHRLALASLQADQPGRARDYLDRALNAAPARADIWNQRIALASAYGSHQEACALCQLALDIAGDTAVLQQQFGDCLRQTGEPAKAGQHYLRALELNPRLHAARFALGTLYAENAQHEKAAHHFQQLCHEDPTHLQAGLALLRALAALGAPLYPWLAQLRERFSADVFALKELAFTLNQLEHFDDALSVAQQGLALDPEHALLHHNASYACNILGDFDAARGHSIEAARLLPHDASAQFNLALTQLRFGDFEQGWKQYVWHEKLPENHDLVRPDWPEWQGEALAGCRFLLIGEQGLGDQLQFLRLAAWLHQRGAQVDVWVDQPLVELARHVTGVHTAWQTLPPGPYDYWCRMTRVAEHMKLELAMLPAMTPYLAAPPEDIEHWRKKLAMLNAGPSVPSMRPTRSAAGDTKRIGLIWAGNPDYRFDRYRSIALPLLAPLLQLPGVTWFSLQKGPAENDPCTLNAAAPMQMPAAHIETFSDTLALLHHLDLLLTVDTSVAHLAGAAGLPMWILLPTCTDWRWMVRRNDSPWYPSARLFRQRELGDWAPVLQDVEAALRAWLKTPR